MGFTHEGVITILTEFRMRHAQEELDHRLPPPEQVAEVVLVSAIGTLAVGNNSPDHFHREFNDYLELAFKEMMDPIMSFSPDECSEILKELSDHGLAKGGGFLWPKGNHIATSKGEQVLRESWKRATRSRELRNELYRKGVDLDSMQSRPCYYCGKVRPLAVAGYCSSCVPLVYHYLSTYRRRFS